MHLHRSPNHSPKQLCNISGIVCVSERYHCFGTRAIPTRWQIFFKENNTNISIIWDSWWLDILYFESTYLNRRIRLSKCMNYLTILKSITNSLFNLTQAIFQICISQLIASAIKNLDYKHRIYIGIMLFIAILSPMFPFFLPVICRSLEYSHVVVCSTLLRVCNNDSILE